MHVTAPENTLAAVERALRQGADGVEVDVRVTADGVPVCHHDPSMRRTADDVRHVAMTAYEDLPWIGSHRVPRLAEVLDLVAGRGSLVVELKSPGWPAVGVAESLDAVVSVLRKHALDHVTISSFDRLRLKAIRTMGLPCPTALLGRPIVPILGLLRQALADGHQEIHPHVSSVLVRPDGVGRAADEGLRVTSWTVDRESDLRLVQEAGAHAVISDDPARARSILEDVLRKVG